MTNEELVQAVADALGVSIVITSEQGVSDLSFDRLQSEYGVEVEASDRNAVRSGAMTLDELRERLRKRRDN